VTFCTGDQIASILGRETSPPFLSQAEEAAAVVTGMIRAATRQTLSLVEGDMLTLTGTHRTRLVVGQRPLVAVASVTVDGATLDPDEYRWTRSGNLWRTGGWWGSDHEIEVECDHGFDPLPDDIVQVARTAAARLLANTEGLVRFEATDQVAETYSGPWGFTIAEWLVLGRYRRRISS
jgi:hypothetical protein